LGHSECICSEITCLAVFGHHIVLERQLTEDLTQPV
jgi:hypothetical protein